MLTQVSTQSIDKRDERKTRELYVSQYSVSLNEKDNKPTTHQFQHDSKRSPEMRTM